MYKQCFKDKVSQRFNNNSIIARKNSFLFENSEENVSNLNKNNFKNLKKLLNSNLNEDYIFSRNNNTEKYIYPLTSLTSSNNQRSNSNNFYPNNYCYSNNNNFKLNLNEKIKKEINKLKVSYNSNRSKELKLNNNNYNNYYNIINSPKYDLNKIQFDSKIEEFKKEIKKDYTLNKNCVIIRDDQIKNQCLNKLYPITNKIDNLLNSPKRSIIKSFSNNNLSNNYNSKRNFYNDYQNNTHFKFINFFNNNKYNDYQYDNLKKKYLKKNKSFYN